jgi:hypothetical protein
VSCMQKIKYSNPSLEVTILTEIVSCFPQSPEENAEISPESRP